MDTLRTWTWCHHVTIRRHKQFANVSMNMATPCSMCMAHGAWVWTLCQHVHVSDLTSPHPQSLACVNAWILPAHDSNHAAYLAEELSRARRAAMRSWIEG